MGNPKTYPTPDILVRGHATVGEGPVWDQRTGRLCWVDINNGTLFENDLATGKQDSSTVNTQLGAVAPRIDAAGFAVAVSGGLGLLVDGELQIIDPVLPEPYRRMNDAKCDSLGRLWAGSTHVEFKAGVGVLHRWDGQTPSVEAARGFALPNGLGWNAEDTVMYLADSMQNVLLRASYSAEEGEVGEFTDLCRIDTGLPDGLAVDMDGCVWLAVWGGWEVHRYDSEGRLIGRIPMPVEKPSSCAFGENGTLVITSATADIPPEELAKQPLAGSVFVVQTDAAGVPVHPFGA